MKQKLFRIFVELSNSPFQSKIIMRFAQSKISKRIIPAFAKTFQINMHEAEKSITEYQSLHAFFTRKLKNGVRTVDDKETSIVSPVDAKIASLGTLTPKSEFQVKGQMYQLLDLLGDREKAQQYVNGHYIVLYLSPKDYHRIHSPLTGEITKQWELGKRSYPVNDAGLKYGKKPLSHNYRSLTELCVMNQHVIMAKVGAMNINTIALTHSHEQLKKGEELGYFSFGSTVILLFEPTMMEFEHLQEGDSVQMGQKIGMLLTTEGAK
ncbi:phosphatidylserine decarboxylase [Alkalihalobacillus pseudalcaliphilus]|uniref:phosphatidylserine decarboxylase n=1 Tax=Alkalihalobacillus pseudalcaliphilus TaxID=79884 RepID=UPI00064DAC09|nr:phosphatidylserine decarboxylase [Alkalihalobacillus pseudalcaliphilus]KMK75908.1 phosphatidylserine decarboxylase [Alkalihalobacillus pseudalcaliphilus]